MIRGFHVIIIGMNEFHCFVFFHLRLHLCVRAASAQRPWRNR